MRDKTDDGITSVNAGRHSHFVRQLVLWILLLSVLVFLDQYTKCLAASSLKTHGPFPLISGALELRYLENRGAAFGILQNRQWIFIIFACVCIIACAWFSCRLARQNRHTLSRVCLAFLAAGAAGNLIDRAVHGYVVDFIYISLIHFPVFNLADMYVSLSTITLVILVLCVYRDEGAGARQHGP